MSDDIKEEALTEISEDLNRVFRQLVKKHGLLMSSTKKHHPDFSLSIEGTDTRTGNHLSLTFSINADSK